jgi:hypothetical protein
MLVQEIVAVYSENRTKPMNTKWHLLIVKAAGN